ALEDGVYATLAKRQERHGYDGDRADRHSRDRTLRLDVESQPGERRKQYEDTEQQEQHRGDRRGTRLQAFDVVGVAAEQFQPQTHEQHDAAQQLDHGVNPERRQEDTARDDPRAYRDARLDQHPGDGHDLQLDASPERAPPCRLHA